MTKLFDLVKLKRLLRADRGISFMRKWGYVAYSFALVCLFMAQSSQLSYAKDYYVDGKFGSNSNPGTQGSAFATIYRALGLVQPGDNIHVMPTTIYNGPFWISGQGTPSAPITIKGEGSGVNMTKVVGSDNFAIQVAESSSYITVQGFDASSPGNYSAIFVSPGATHISIVGNRAHDSGGAGIGSSGADYLTITNNIVFNNAHNTSVACASGISLYQLRNTDDSIAIKNYVINNFVYENTNTPSLIPSFQVAAKSLPKVLHCATASLNLAMSGASLCSGMVGIRS